MSPKRLVVLVTGANSGIGYVTCERLLIQLSQPNPPDAWPQFDPNVSYNGDKAKAPSSASFDFSPSAGITIIMACRNVERAEAARTRLFKSLDAHVARLRQRRRRETREECDYATLFRENVEIAIHKLDLSTVRSIFEFKNKVSQKYSYISHLICNAGVAAWSHIDFSLFFYALAFYGPIETVESPSWSAQRSGVMSSDGLGWVWQSNVFGHYVLFRQLQPLLAAYSSGDDPTASSPARVLWMSSIEAQPCFDEEDWQLIKTAQSYQGSKYQLDVLCAELSRRAQGEELVSSSSADQMDSATLPSSGKILHVLVSPGIRITELATEVHKVVPLAMLWIWLLFSWARIVGSRNVFTASVYQVAVCPVHFCLVPHAYIPNTVSRYFASHPPGSVVKFGAQNTLLGQEYVGILPLSKRLDRPGESSRLLARCEHLYQTYLKDEQDLRSPAMGQGENGNGHA